MSHYLDLFGSQCQHVKDFVSFFLLFGCFGAGRSLSVGDVWPAGLCLSVACGRPVSYTTCSWGTTTTAILIVPAIVCLLQGESLPKLVPVTSVLCRSYPCHDSKLYNLIFCRPRLREPVICPHSAVIFVHLLYSVLARCPAHLHFLILTCFMISWILVLLSDPFASYSIFLGNS